MIFPFYKRATAIGICNLIARTFTIGAFIVAELPRPWPAALLIFLTVATFVDLWFLPSYEAEIEFEKRQEELAAASKEQGKELDSDQPAEDQNSQQAGAAGEGGSKEKND